MLQGFPFASSPSMTLQGTSLSEIFLNLIFVERTYFEPPTHHSNITKSQKDRQIRNKLKVGITFVLFTRYLTCRWYSKNTKDIC